MSNHHILSTRHFSMICAITMAFSLICAGCSEDVSGTAAHLLQTVPATASGVAMANVPLIVENAGGKIDDGNIVFDTKTDTGIRQTRVAGSNSIIGSTVDLILNSGSGIEATAIAAFTDPAAGNVITGMITDSSLFSKFTESSTGSKTSRRGKVSVCGRFCSIGNQFWCFERQALPEKAEEWSELSDQQSYASKENVSNLKEASIPMCGRIDINALIRNNATDNFKKTMQMQMALSALFDDAAFLDFTLTFNKAEGRITLTPLTSKGERAAFNLPFDKVNGKNITSLGGTAEAFAAINISRRLVKKIQDMLGQLGGIPLPIAQILDPVDGNCIFKFSGQKNIDAVIPVDASDTSALQNMLSSLGSVSRSGSTVRLTSGQPIAGTIQSASAARRLDGCYLGIVASPDFINKQRDDIGSFRGIADITLMLRPESGGVDIIVSASGKKNDAGILRQMTAY